jgi:hypothetical protein
MVAQVRYSVARGSRGQVTLCVVCSVHVEMRSAGFLVEPQNQGRWFVSSLASKPLGRFVSGLASKPLRRFLPVWPQNQWYGFLQFGLKTDGDGFLRFGLKIGGDGFYRFDLKTSSLGFLVWASKPVAVVW